MTSKQGVSAKELQRQLKVSYTTAWTWLHKVRFCISALPKIELEGEIEIDETYVGGHAPDAQGRCTDFKSVVTCAVEKRGRGCGRAWLGLVENASGKELSSFVKQSAADGATIHTDAWRGNSALHRSGYRHIATCVNASGNEAHESLPRVHRIFSLVKRWLMGTHQGSVSKKHLQAYPP